MKQSWWFFIFLMVVSSSVLSLGLDDDEEDQEDASDYLQQAEQASEKKQFSQAKQLVKKAKALAVYSSDVKDTESNVLAKETAYKKKIAAEKRARERRARERLARANRAYGSSSGSGSSVDMVMVDFNPTCGFNGCSVQRFSVSGGPSPYHPTYSGASTGYIGDYGGITGTYQWSASFGGHYCSGSFYLSGRSRNYTVAVYKNCSDAGSREW